MGCYPAKFKLSHYRFQHSRWKLARCGAAECWLAKGRTEKKITDSSTFMNPTQVPNGIGKHVNVLGIPIFIRLRERDTGGVLSVVESLDLPGGGPLPHIHQREDETFQVLEGDFEFSVGGKTIIAKPGATVFAPCGVPHTYRYLGQTTGRLMCVITPSGFEEFFEEIGAMSPQPPQDIP
jgi:quercetin dioxygenase-like cupin family protein